jgi:ribosomal protein S4
MTAIILSQGYCHASKEDIDLPIEEHLIVELYSK